MTPKISVLIPVFQRKHLIAECIQSAIDQTFTDLEVVVVDNASNDGTWEICKHFAERDSRVRAFQNETNIGPVRNWKRCAEEAKGEYSKILFSDDILEIDCLAKMIKALDDPDVAFVYSSVLIGKSKSEANLAYRLQGNRRISPKQFFNFASKGKAPLSPGAVLLRTKDLINNLHLSFPTTIPHSYADHGAGSDIMIMLLTSEKYRWVAHIEEPLVYFRVHDGSFSIANQNNLITTAYRSIFSYYAMTRLGWLTWISYVAGIWIEEVIQSKKWIDMKLFLLNHEGNALMSEYFIVLILIPYYVSMKSLRWVLCFFRS